MNLRLQRIAASARVSLRSRLAWVLVCLHGAWFFLAIAKMSPPSPGFAKFLESGGGSDATLFAGRPFHFYYASLALQSLILADLPSMLAGISVGLSATPILRLAGLDLYASSYVDAALMLLLASCQWLVIGAFFQSRLSSFIWGKWLLRNVERYFVFLVVTILVVTAIATPMVNARSRRLGLRRPAISFH